MTVSNSELKFGKERKKEKQVGDHVPYLRHVSDRVVVTKSGSLISVIQMGGLPFQTMDQAELNARLMNRNTTFRNLSSSRFAVYATIIRRHIRPEIEGDFDNPLVAELDARYLDSLSQKNLFVNEVYLSVLRRPMTGKIGIVDKFFDQFRKHSAGEESREEAIKELEDVAEGIEQDFRSYGSRILSVVKRDQGVFSEPAEFFAKILTGGEEVQIPLPRMSLASAIPSRQILFGKEAFEIRSPNTADNRIGAMLSMKEYPPYTTPGGLDGMLRLPHEFILTQSFSIEDRVAAMTHIRKIGRQVEGSDEGGTSVETSVDAGMDKLANGEVIFGTHHLSVCVTARSVSGLNKAIADVSSEIQRMAIIPVREKLNLEPAFWAQLPGNFAYIARKGLISSANFAGLFSGHNFPSGDMRPKHWKTPIALLETTSQTAYYFNFHVHDVGHFTIMGPTGSGKTVGLAFLIAQAMRVKPRPRCVFIDKDRSADTFVRALGGYYEILEPGVPTGFAPLQLDDTPENRNFVDVLLQYMLQPDDRALDAAEIKVIGEAVDMIFRLPKERRVLSMVPEVLRGRLQPGMNDLVSRMEPWINPKGRGWLFNNEVDMLDFGQPIIGFDMTKVLNEPKIRTAALLYMFFRIEQQLNGDPFMLMLDEGWRLLDDPIFVEIIKDFAKTARKKNGMIGFGTQSAADVVNSSISNTLIEQTTTNIFFPNSKADERSYRQHFNLTSKEFRFVKETSKDSRTFLVKHASDSIVAKLDLGDMMDLVKVLSATPATVRECEELRARYGDDPAAWLPYFCGWEIEADEQAA